MLVNIEIYTTDPYIITTVVKGRKNGFLS